MTPRPVIAFDLGLSTGWGVRLPDGALRSGAIRVKEATAERYEFFRHSLLDLFAEIRPAAAGYERVVVAHRGTRAGHVYGALESILWSASAEAGVELWGFGIGQWKVGALGKGNGLASPSLYRAMADDRWPGVVATTDEAAARWMASWWSPGQGTKIALEGDSRNGRTKKKNPRGKGR